MSWEKVTIDSIKSEAKYSLVGGPFGSNLVNADYVDEGVPVIRGTNLSDNAKFDESDFVFVTEEKASKLLPNTARPGDLLFTQRGTLGQVGIIPKTSSYNYFIISQSQMKLTVAENRAVPLFVYYYFKSADTKQQIINRAITSGVPHINLGILKNFEIVLPPIETQKRIAEILSAYDDLIENNLKRIRLLEESARLLYREWFVRLKFPNHEHTPLIDGLPEGWEKGSISDFYDTASGGTPSRTNPDYFTGENFWIKTQELKDSFVIDTDEKITDEALKHSAAKLFPAKTVLVAMYGATIGQLGITACPSATNQACCALMPRVHSANYIYAFLFLKENKQQLINLSMGAAQNNINQQTVRNFEMILPSEKVMENFVEITEPMFKAISNLLEQNKKLKQARDLLLPRLISGEIAV